ncbi:MAG: UDP-glucose 4-epimerase GalE [Immundisolibacter sp.]
MRLLVTGGAGYIGSHVVLQLAAAGHQVTVYDNLSTGFRWATRGVPLIEADLADTARLDETFARGGFEAVLHFAAHIVVPESVADPLKYYANNTANTLGLLQAMQRHGVSRLVFSSTAAVYGNPQQLPVAETAAPAPINPYGSSKLMSEWMIRDLSATGALDHVTLRYFNVAGAEAGGRLGQATAAATHLIKVACELACGKRERLQVFGTDYPTPDGTCVRDYIHIDDLARAHVLALDHLAAGGPSLTLNCGYGHGYSVREVLAAVERALGRPLAVQDAPRRPGDPAILVAESSRIRQALGWQPQHDDLDFIVRTALDWERRLPGAD